MTTIPDPAPAALRAARAAHPGKRERDLAKILGVSEGALLAADVGREAVAIAADPARLLPLLAPLGEVLALTRNESAVHECVGRYAHWDPAAGHVSGPGLDLRILAAHWVHAFAVERPGEAGPRRSVQVFDAAGEAVHKVHLRPASDAGAFAALREALRRPEQAEALAPAPAAPGVAGGGVAGGGVAGGWAAEGEAGGTPLAPAAVTAVLEAAAAQGLPLAVVAGNAGAVQAFSGPVHRIVAMGPWINVLDPGFDLHLRQDHVADLRLAEGWLTARDGAGAPVLRIGPGVGADPAGWAALLAALPRP